MKGKKIIASVFLMALCAGCGNSHQEKETGIITVDVHADYPEKKLMLQDILEVEYIPLETSDEFITQGYVLDIGDRYILAKNRTPDGDIFLFDRQTGKGIRKINRKGQGAEEYTSIYRIVLDEANDEMFVNCMPMRKIFVYDLEGRFKRCFNHADSASYSVLFNYDREHLISYDMSIYYKEGMPSEGRSSHAIISKQDGSVTRKIPIPFEIVKAPIIKRRHCYKYHPIDSALARQVSAYRNIDRYGLFVGRKHHPSVFSKNRLRRSSDTPYDGHDDRPLLFSAND